METRTRTSLGWPLVVALSSLLATACYDADDPCGGEGQEYSEDSRLCVCRDGFRLVGNGCEEAPALMTEEETDVTEETDTADSETDGHTADGGSADDGVATDAPPVDDGPTGLGMSCTSNDDCADSEATFCDTFVAGICLVEGCDVGATDCPLGYQCQDLSMFGAGGNVCVPATCDVAANDCPAGFTCCEPAIPGFPAVCLAAGCGD